MRTENQDRASTAIRTGHRQLAGAIAIACALLVGGCWSPSRRLAKAAVFSDSATCRKLVARHPDLRDQVLTRRFGAPPLVVFAVEARDCAFLRELLDLGADLSLATGGGFTALHAAAQGNEAHMMEMLLGTGRLDVDVRSGGPLATGATPLMLAAFTGGTPVVRLLLDAGAEVNAQDEKGYSPVFYAVVARDAGGSRSVVDLLIEEGADLSLRDRKGRTVRDFAKERGKPQP